MRKSDAERAKGIASETLKAHTRAKRKPAESPREKADRLREDLRLRILEAAADVLGRISQPHLERVALSGKLAGQVVDIEHPRPTPGGVRDYSVAFGVLLDKYRLEMGEVTERQRTEHVGQVPADQLERDIARIASVSKLRSA